MLSVANSPAEIISGLENNDTIEGVEKLYQVLLTPAAAVAKAELKWLDPHAKGYKTVSLQAPANGASVSFPSAPAPMAIRRQDITVTLSGAGANLAIMLVGYQKLVSGAVPVYVNGRENLVSQVTALRESSKNLLSKVTARRYSTANALCKVTARLYSSKNLLTKITALKKSTSSVVSRVTALKKATGNLVSQLTVRQNATASLPCQVTPTNIPASANLPCQVTPTNIPSSANLVSQVTARKNATANLVCQVTKA